MRKRLAIFLTILFTELAWAAIIYQDEYVTWTDGGPIYVWRTPLFYSPDAVWMPKAATDANGYLDQTDWDTFNAKVTGPASSTDNAIARFDGTAGNVIQDSNVTLSDAGVITLTDNDYGHVYTVSGGWYIDMNEVVLPDDMNAVNAGSDEDILTYESSTGPTLLTDPNCVAWWRFESGAIGADSKGGNTLAQTGGTIDADTTDYQEGTASGVFQAADTEYMWRSDATLDSDFPLKNGSTNTSISLCGWFKADSLPAVGQLMMYWQKGTGAAGNSRSFQFDINNNGGTTYPRLMIGYNSGNTWEVLSSETTAVTTGIWYHVGATYNGTTREWRMRIWDDNAGALLGGAEQTGTGAETINVEAGAVQLGTYWASNYWDGHMDSILIFNDVLSADEIDQVRQETYGAGGSDSYEWHSIDELIGGATIYYSTDSITLAAGQTTFPVSANFMTVTGDGGGNTIATITGATAGMPLTLLFTNNLVTITDTDAHTADTVDCAGTATNFTSADDKTLQLIYNGTSWYETSRSVN